MNYEASIENPIDVTITNNTDVNQTIRYFMVNFQTTLKPGDSVTFAFDIVIVELSASSVLE